MTRKSSPRGVTTAAYKRPSIERQHLQAGFAVVSASILHDPGRLPFEPLHEIEGQTTLSDVPRALLGVERESHIL